MLNRKEILSTIEMIDQQHLDIRTITMGISLLDCCHSDIDTACGRIYDKITRYAANLVSTGEALTAETATAQVTLIDGAKQTIDYSGDVNMSDKVDLNDAQLVYDLYNASYYDFSVVSMEKMLRADVSKDKKIDVSDVTAIVAIVRK